MVIGQPEHGTACTRIARGPRGAYELQHERALRALRGRRDGGASHERAKAIHLLLQPRGLGALLDELGAQPPQLGAGRGLNPLEEGGQQHIWQARARLDAAPLLGHAGDAVRGLADLDLLKLKVFARQVWHRRDQRERVVPACMHMRHVHPCGKRRPDLPPYPQPQHQLPPSPA